MKWTKKDWPQAGNTVVMAHVHGEKLSHLTVQSVGTKWVTANYTKYLVEDGNEENYGVRRLYPSEAHYRESKYLKKLRIIASMRVDHASSVALEQFIHASGGKLPERD